MKKSKTLSMTLYESIDNHDGIVTLVLVSGDEMVCATKELYFGHIHSWLTPNRFCCFNNLHKERLDASRFKFDKPIWSKEYQSNCDCSERG